MKKQLVIASALMLALAGPLAGCSSSDASAPAAEAETAEAAADESTDSDFDAVAYYYGTWRGSVETTGETIYGTAGGSEQMIDVILNEDGTAETKPCKNHEDLLTETGTWEASDDKSVTIHLESCDITLETVDSATLRTDDPTQFGIDGFDEMTFVLY